jgi:large conductance mechanosensitive channel
MEPFKRVESALKPEKAFSLWDEFKKFAFKGNVVDLAVGVIIGAAFGKIVNSLVSDLMMPLITAFTPSDKSYLECGWTIHGQHLALGKFLGEVVNFLLIALILFVFVVKFLGWILKARREEAVVPQPPTRQEQLLMEIRDLLASSAGKGSGAG